MYLIASNYDEFASLGMFYLSLVSETHLRGAEVVILPQKTKLAQQGVSLGFFVNGRQLL
jgi:hypothetical protein